MSARVECLVKKTPTAGAADKIGSGCRPTAAGSTTRTIERTVNLLRFGRFDLTPRLELLGHVWATVTDVLYADQQLGHPG